MIKISRPIVKINVLTNDITHIILSEKIGTVFIYSQS